MTDKRDKSHNPSARTLARWETEGGAPKEGRNPTLPRDTNQLAKLIADIDRGESEDRVTGEKDPRAVGAGHLGGRKGGIAHTNKLSPEERKRIALRAARARWDKRG